MSGNWTGGSTAAWRKARAAVLLRDKVCRLKTSTRCNGRAETVHHTQDRAVVGDNPKYLIAACKPCNYGYGSPTQEKYGNPPHSPKTEW